MSSRRPLAHPCPFFSLHNSQAKVAAHATRLALTGCCGTGMYSKSGPQMYVYVGVIYIYIPLCVQTNTNMYVYTRIHNTRN